MIEYRYSEIIASRVKRPLGLIDIMEEAAGRFETSAQQTVHHTSGPNWDWVTCSTIQRTGRILFRARLGEDVREVPGVEKYHCGGRTLYQLREELVRQ